MLSIWTYFVYCINAVQSKITKYPLLFAALRALLVHTLTMCVKAQLDPLETSVA